MSPAGSAYNENGSGLGFRMRVLFRYWAWAFLVPLCAATSGPIWSQAERLGIDAASQYRLCLKILSFDRNLKAKLGDGLTMGILYVGVVNESRQAMDDFARAAAAGPVDFEGVPVRIVPVKYGKEAQVEAALAEASVDVLYVTPIGFYDLAPVTAACRARGVYTFSGVSEYVERGLSVSFGVRGRRAEIFISQGNAQAEGADFSARLLDMVTVVDVRPRGETR
jgi:hypothetical protein